MGVALRFQAPSASHDTPVGVMVPGTSISSAARRARRSRSRWNSGWWGRPTVWPSGRSEKAARGGFTDAVMLNADVRQSVGTSAASRALATRPTVWWQTGQTGTSSARSTSMATTSATTAGASSSVARRTE